MLANRRPLLLVVIYSRKDADLLREMLDHLSPLQFQGIVEIWYDQDLEPGMGWRQEIERRLDSAQIVLILVSASCLASHYCRAEIDLTLALHDAKRLRAVPVKLHEVDWEGERLSNLQLLPSHGGALATSPNRHAEMADVARAVRKLALQESGERRAPAQPQRVPSEAGFETQLARAGSPGSLRSVHAVSDLALAQADLGHLSSARVLLEAAIQTAREANGSDLSILLSNYAHVLRQAGELEAARASLEEALTLSSASDPALAIRLDRLAGVLHDLGVPEIAREHAEQALAISLQAHGTDHPAVAVRHNTLGMIWMDLGKPQTAICEFEESLAILLRRRDESHPSVAAVRGNLALALRDRGDLDQAKRLAERVLADDGKAYPDSHPAVATDLNTLGLILRDRGETSAAARCLRNAQQIFARALGELHPSTRAVRENLRVLIAAGGA